MARSERGGLSFLEVILASCVLVVAIPPLVESWITVGKVDHGQLERGQAANLSQAVLEQIHYRMYNGTQQGDVRGGIKLNDALDSRVTRYQGQPPSYLSFFYRQKESDLPVVPTSGSEQSQFFSSFLGGPPGEGDVTTRKALESYRCRVNVLPYLDTSPSDPDLAAKSTSQPKVDMAHVEVSMAWTNAAGAELRRTFVTRFSRHIYETDVLASTTGR